MDSQELHLLLTREPWRQHFDPSLLHRGLDLVRAGEVRVLQHIANDGGNDMWLARIGRNASNSFECQIEAPPAGGRGRIRFSCGCRRQTLCEHAAALLTYMSIVPAASWFHADDAPGPAGTGVTLARWDRWLDQVSSNARRPATAAAQRVFGLMLRAQAAREFPAAFPWQEVDSHLAAIPRLLAAPVWLRPGKRGDALVDPQGLHMSALGAEPAPAEGWPDETLSALSVLLGDADVSHGALRLTRIAARQHEHAMEQLMARYPVFFEKASAGALHRAEDRQLQLRWEDQDDGSQRLAVAIADGGHLQLLRAAQYWYIDSKAQCYGRVQGNASLLEALANAPSLEPEDVASFSAHLASHGAVLDLPTPNPRGPVELLNVTPKPVLLLRRERNWPVITHSYLADKRVEVGCARLLFDYGPARVDALDYHSVVRRMRQGTVYEVARKIDAEHAAARLLLDAKLADALELFYAQTGGFAVVEEGDWVLSLGKRKPPAAPEAWQPVLQQLAQAGFTIEFADDFPRDRLVATGDWHAELAVDDNGWFDLQLGIEVDGERIDLLPILRRLLADPEFPQQPYPGEKPDATWRVLIDEQRSAELPLQRLRELTEPLLEWLQAEPGPSLRLHRTQAENLARLADRDVLHWRGSEILRARITRLRESARSEIDTPDGFTAPLRPYQREGLAWLDFLAEAGLGGVLADDMGLGKTVQVLAHLLLEKRCGRLEQPALVVCPTSLVGNWRDEAARFTPQLRVLVIHGAGRADTYDEIGNNDLIITTYPLLPRDRESLIAQQFSLLIVDEAQAIKNARSQAAQVVREIPARRRLAMTGTPLENHLGELWAQFDAVEPGLLGSERQFTRLYRTPIEKQGDNDRQQRLNQRIGTLLLRRRKEDVLADLPAKTEIVRRIELEGDQRSFYETLRLAQHERVREAVRERGLNQSGIIVLDALLKLRQVCCDPSLVKLASAKKVHASAKREALHELLDGLLAEGRRVLLFSQFTEMLGRLAADFDARKSPYLMLTGDTPGRLRSDLVQRFQDGEVPLFLISLKAGGVGLNLTAADTVIHYDPWWNPAAEAQATDRAHRIGQDKPVFVYKLICAGTVEEKIQALQARKSDLARAVLEGGASQRLRFDESDMAELFAPLQ
jgi:superfamily II DNA or RNA helicase